MVIFIIKKCDIILIFAQNMDSEAVLTCIRNLFFRAKILEICIPV